MSTTSQFLVYVTAFRLAIIAAGIVSMILGYRLFIRGIYPIAGRESSIDFKAAGSGFTLKNAAPGTCFGLFGVVLITSMLVQGSPQFTYEMMQKVTGAESPITSTKFELRGGGAPQVSTALLEKGMAYEKAGDIADAAEAYEQALSQIATPMNQLAWLYYKQGKSEEALPLARLAVDIDPGNPALLDTLAEVLEQQGQRVEAVKWMSKAAGIDSRYQAKLEQFKRVAR